MNVFIYVFIPMLPTCLYDVLKKTTTYLCKCPFHVSTLIFILIFEKLSSEHFASTSILPDAHVTVQFLLYFLRFSYSSLCDINHLY